MITLKAAAIIGTGDTTYENARDLLDDFLPEDCQIYVPSYISDPGLKNVLKWLNDYGVSYERVKRDRIVDVLGETIGLAALIVIGTEGLEDEIKRAYLMGIPVYDLAAALWAVPDPTEEPQLPLYEPESHADRTESSSGTSVRVPDDHGLESLSEPQGRTWTEREIRSLVMTILHSEFNWEPGSIPITGAASITGLPPTADETDGIKYYKSKTGKYRKAGRSKARTGETEVYLSQEEADKLNGE